MTHPVRARESVSGQPLTRVDGPLKVTGAARYAADNPVPGLLHAALVCSGVARGGVERVDSAAALAHSGVLRVLTGFRVVGLPFDPMQVAFFGQPVAVVVASTPQAAAHGASLVTVYYRPAPQQSDIDSPQATGKPGPPPA
ncbi:MAG TPA: hypothetical protein VMU34_15515 [Mycobacterium sp.]|nr:hypothetical protein [Mycobacterium sp.]